MCLLVKCHSPLTGIFLIRRSSTPTATASSTPSHSPLTGIFLIRRAKRNAHDDGNPDKSQSPDGDFFDPAFTVEERPDGTWWCHSPLTGIFLIRRTDCPKSFRHGGLVTVP